MMLHSVVVSLAWLLCAPLSLSAQQQADPASGATAAAALATPRVHVIGASVSGGFRDGPLTGAKEPGDSVTLQHVLKAWCGEHARATTHAPLQMLAMFTDPVGIGEKQIQATKKANPALVVAIDFPFWFAYGYFDAGDEAKQRLARHRQGLELLASLGVPVLVGDLPDMQGAARRMLSPAQIPAPELLQQLNAQLATFVQQHPQLRVVPLAALVAQMKNEGIVLPLAKGPLRTLPGALLQGDRLHANRLGMAYLGLQLQPALQALFPADHPLRKQTWTFEQFIDACGADDELANARAAAKVAAGAGK
jgi:hypothetical protein